MAGRPKNPNRPPTVTAVRLTARTRERLEKEHRRFGGNEPYNNTIERALMELEHLRKKGIALEDLIQGLEGENRLLKAANNNLTDILKKRDETLDRVVSERRQIHAKIQEDNR